MPGSSRGNQFVFVSPGSSPETRYTPFASPNPPRLSVIIFLLQRRLFIFVVNGFCALQHFDKYVLIICLNIALQRSYTVFHLISTDEERQRFLEDLSAADDWLFDQEMDAAAKVFTDKLSSLQKDFSSFFKRLREKEQRPRAIAELLTHLNHSQHFYSKS